MDPITIIGDTTDIMVNLYHGIRLRRGGRTY